MELKRIIVSIDRISQIICQSEQQQNVIKNIKASSKTKQNNQADRQPVSQSTRKIQICFNFLKSCQCYLRLKRMANKS